MTIHFPSADFFNALRQRVAADPGALAGVDPSEAYCGLAIGDSMYVLEFDGQGCAGVAPGGNPLDLDFVLAGPAETWRELVVSLAAGREDGALAQLVKQGALEIRSEEEEGSEIARQSLPFLEAFLGQARHLDVQFG